MAIDRSCLEASLEVVQKYQGTEKRIGSDGFGLGAIHLFKTLPSTNQKLWQLIEQGAGSGTVAIASQQTAGRGQWGRTWRSPRGGLYLSLALMPDLAAECSAHLTLSIAWGIANELRCWGIPVQLKWPNDLVLCRRKLGGILTETRVRQGKIAAAVVGVGINWANSVPETGINLATFLERQQSDNGPPPPRSEETSMSAARRHDLNFVNGPGLNSLETVAAIALEGILSGWHHLQTEGIETLLPAYTSLLNNLGGPVTVNGRLGHVVGVSAVGELQVQFEPDPSLLFAGVMPDSAGNQFAIAPPETTVAFKPGTLQLGYE